jgi:hypothetical protein
MTHRIKSELDWKQKAKGNVTLGAKLFGILRNTYTKINRSKSDYEISEYAVAETARVYKIRAEKEKAEATCILARNTRTI